MDITNARKYFTETLNFLKNNHSHYPPIEYFNLAIYAIDKQIPQKIIFNSENDREYEDYICPNCKNILQQRRKGVTAITIYKFKHCHNCGQMLDWSES